MSTIPNKALVMKVLFNSSNLCTALIFIEPFETITLSIRNKHNRVCINTNIETGLKIGTENMYIFYAVGGTNGNLKTFFALVSACC